MEENEYWLVTVNYPTAKLFVERYATFYLMHFPDAKELISDDGYEGNIVFMKQLTEEQYKKLTSDTSQKKRDYILHQSLIRDFGFPLRCLNAFHELKLDTVYDLTQITKVDFLKSRYVGKKTLTIVDEFLKEHGLDWKHLSY